MSNRDSDSAESNTINVAVKVASTLPVSESSLEKVVERDAGKQPSQPIQASQSNETSSVVSVTSTKAVALIKKTVNLSFKNDDESIKLRALFDSGASRSFIRLGSLTKNMQKSHTRVQKW